MRGGSFSICLRGNSSAATVRSGFELFGELVISGQDVVAVVYGENITKGSPVVVKIDFDPTKIANPAVLPTGNGGGCAFDPTGTYLAVAHVNSPYITIYDGFSRAVFQTGNSILDIQEGGVIAAGYAKEDGLAGETKEIVRIWRLGG